MSFLDNYKVYSSGNEAPPIYHTWAGISALSSLVSRRVWLSQGQFTVYPNLYVLFVGNPGNGKSTAMKIARRLVRKFGKTSPVAPASITREALTKDLGDPEGDHRLSFKYRAEDLEYCHVSIFANELVTLLGTSPLHMIEFLTDIWDEEEEFKVKTKNKGSDSIPRPNVTLLGCMTPDTTNNLLKENIISGGFARRCIFVYADRRGDPIPRPQTTPEQREAEAACIKWGQKLAVLNGEFVWTDDAIELFDSWYVENYELVQENTDLLLNGYYTTKNMLVLKVAMMLSLSKTLDLTLHAEQIQQAIDLLGKTEKHLSRVFEGTGRNPEAGIAAKIMSLVTSRREAVKRKEVTAEMFKHGTLSEINEAIQHLVTANKIQELTTDFGGMVGTAEQIACYQESLKASRSKLAQPDTADPSAVAKLRLRLRPQDPE